MTDCNLYLPPPEKKVRATHDELTEELIRKIVTFINGSSPGTPQYAAAVGAGARALNPLDRLVEIGLRLLPDSLDAPPRLARQQLGWWRNAG